MDRFLSADDLDKALRRDVEKGLTDKPKWLPPKWFYDERGSALFEEITRLSEYYPTRRERAILAERAAEIAAATGSRTLLELGAGSGDKTRLLLDALGGTLHTYLPVDVSGDFLLTAAGRIARDHPWLSVRAVVADYERHLHLLPTGDDRLIAFLGGTIGNMPPAERAGFLSAVRATMAASDALLLGVDLVKDRNRLIRAYDDGRGVTAEFNRNVLHVINHRLGADFAPDAYEHVVRWDAANEWIEMHLRAVREQIVRIRALDLTVRFAAGEKMRTEISAKFRMDRLCEELEAAGLALDRWWTDPDGDFALTLARPMR